MKILALEFSSSRRSVAVADDGGALLGSSARSEGRDTIALIEEALAQAGSEREEIGLLAVGLGPGSYAGIRAAVALAQGWQIGREVKTLGLSSVACLAADAQSLGLRGEINIVIDAQRNEFYVARFQIEADELRVIEPLRLAACAEIELLAAKASVAGPDLASWFPTATHLFPDAATLARLAAAQTDFIPADRLEPIYLRATAFVKAPPPRIIADRS